MDMESPQENIALSVASDITTEPILGLSRFATGQVHYVYDVKTENDEFVIRLTKSDHRQTFAGALYWYHRLKPKGVPLPAIRWYDLNGEKYGFPVIVTDRLPGRDLEDVYTGLTTRQKESLASEIVNIQNTVATLDHANGFGYALAYDDPKLYATWHGVMDLYLNRIKTRNAKTRLIDEKYIGRLEELLQAAHAYIASVKPVPFLDDITTKNVIIHNGKLSGIVDVDTVCFGDPLLTLGLTHASLLAMKVDTCYTDYWASLLHLTEEQRSVVSIYTAMFALEFASGMGQTFNSDKPESIDPQNLHHLTSIFERITSGL
jgi:aminoglycoside phosphotransferase (APT) family kinase protein